MTICAVADLHGWLPPVPPCDLLLIAGDICPPTNQRVWLDTAFRAWLRGIPVAQVIATWGNNDVVADRRDVPELPCTFLVDDTVSRAGLRIYGAPWTTGLSYQAWASEEQDDLLVGLHHRLPDRIDILLSHIPPLGVLDQNRHGIRHGSRTLLDEINRVRPAVTICGHVHASRGEHEFEWGGSVYNVAALDARRQPRPDPVVRIDARFAPGSSDRRRRAAHKRPARR
jgi:Icc-related predicted phosphoesterase